MSEPDGSDVRTKDPNPPAPRTYLNMAIVQAHLQHVERTVESHEYLYRSVMVAILNHFFLQEKGFDVFQEPPGEIDQTESRAQLVVLKFISPPGGCMHGYDFCLVESKMLFFTANSGVLTALSGGLHVRNVVNTVTTMMENMKNRPLPVTRDSIDDPDGGKEYISTNITFRGPSFYENGDPKPSKQPT
ncbi:hypothetical protein M501DRAFT_991734 [Patellaria atrata CBS 101060]|uniref:Uncharacterized protein n=1 Tax=Patellaria atrata CBS 101060 TaxID=1346257 RepID=A0A9P4SDE7_9PEZI|nr:hypothetical protein M501DRAFT_991734 [Patellaria atrata CBS 101060]